MEENNNRIITMENNNAIMVDAIAVGVDSGVDPDNVPLNGGSEEHQSNTDTAAQVNDDKSCETHPLCFTYPTSTQSR